MITILNSTKYLLLIFIASIVIGCNNNEIYYDMNQGVIATCNEKAITNLFIENEENTIFHHFSKLPEKDGTNRFSLYTLNENYKIENTTKEIALSDFSLEPEMVYKISNTSFGDASASEIIIKTNEISEIIYSDRVSCE